MRMPDGTVIDDNEYHWLIAERDEARQEAKKWRDKALYQRTVPALIAPLPWEADHA